MNDTLWLVLYCVLILLASLCGGWFSLWLRLTHKGMELCVSFVAGVMLGVVLFHMLPHAMEIRIEHGLAPGNSHVHASGSIAHTLINPIMYWLLAGFLVMFFIERYFCFHHHDAPNGPPHDHNHHHHPPHIHPTQSRHQLTWAGAAIGLSIHSLIEGVALAASYEAAFHDDHLHAAFPALGTFLVIALHKPFDSLTLGTLMNIGGRSASLRHLVNAAFSLLVPVGIALFYLGLTTGNQGGPAVTSAALAFSAGTFLCIALSDLLPELQFHQHDRGKLSLALLAGLALAWLINILESQTHHH